MADWQKIIGGIGAGLQDAGAHLQRQPGQANNVSQFNEYRKELDNDKEYKKAAKDWEVVHNWMQINKFTTQQEMIQRMQGSPTVWKKYQDLAEYGMKPGKRNQALWKSVTEDVKIQAQTQKKEIAEQAGTLESQMDQGFITNPNQTQQVPAHQAGLLGLTKHGGQNAQPAQGPMFQNMANPPLNVQAPPVDTGNGTDARKIASNQERWILARYPGLKQDPSKITGKHYDAYDAKVLKDDLTRIREENRLKPASPASASERKSLTENIHQYSALENLEKLYDDSYVGFIEGRKGTLRDIFGGNKKKQAEFVAAGAALKNYVIKLITGAQMSEKEATRILQQVPTVNNPEVTWKARLDQTKNNIEMLLKAQVGVLKDSGMKVPVEAEKIAKGGITKDTTPEEDYMTLFGAD